MDQDGFFLGRGETAVGAALDPDDLVEGTGGFVQDRAIVLERFARPEVIIGRIGLGGQEDLLIQDDRDHIDVLGISPREIPFLGTVGIHGIDTGFIVRSASVFIVGEGQEDRSVLIHGRRAGGTGLGTVIAAGVRIVQVGVKDPFLVAVRIESDQVQAAGESIDHAAIGVGGR